MLKAGGAFPDGTSSGAGRAASTTATRVGGV